VPLHLSPSTTIAHDCAADATTQELAAKLNSEIALEKEQQADDSYRYNCQEYIDNSEFKIEDKPGQEEVHLTRTYGDEKFVMTISTMRLPTTY
jgi:complement component 1 Q subcomponent-binding protein